MHQWFLLVGALPVAMAFGSSVVQRLPISPAMLYLAVGVGIGPRGAAWLDVDDDRQHAGATSTPMGRVVRHPRHRLAELPRIRTPPRGAGIDRAVVPTPRS